MYAEHVPIIAAGMRDNPVTFTRGALFALLSARVPFRRVPELLADVDRHGSNAQALFGWKWDAYAHLMEHGEQLWGSLCRSTSIAEALWSVTRVPGAGVVKGAFILQLMGFDVACLDTRNIKREGRNPREYRSDGEAGKTTPAFRAKIERYLADCGGRAQEYWDIWCNDLGQQYGTTGEDISQRHLTAIIPRRHVQQSLTRVSCPIISLPSEAIPF